MARKARGESIDPHKVQIVHTIQRCVRQAFLCGFDRATGVSFEHRRSWIRSRLEFLSSIFGIDCLTYTVLSNHLHIVLRSRPDVVLEWTDEEVAQRWLRLSPDRVLDSGELSEPTDAEIGMIVNNPEDLMEIRTRLSDISWWMSYTSQNIATRANRSEGITGRFWDGRFKSQLITDEASLLACAMYVDLNPIRAAMAENLEQSDFTGAKDRIDDLKQHPSASRELLHCLERDASQKRSGWMSPLEIDEANDPIGADLSPIRRASNKGFLPISLKDYLELLDWTGRSIRTGKRGSIPADLAPILTRIGLDADSWCTLVKDYGRLFKRVAGSAESLAVEAERQGQKYFQAPGLALFKRSAA